MTHLLQTYYPHIQHRSIHPLFQIVQLPIFTRYFVFWTHTSQNKFASIFVKKCHQAPYKKKATDELLNKSKSFKKASVSLHTPYTIDVAPFFLLYKVFIVTVLIFFSFTSLQSILFGTSNYP